MQLEERISRACGRVAWSLFKGGLVCLVKAYTPVVFPLFALASLMAMLVGSEAWWPFLGFLKASAPLLFGLAFCVMLPSILGAVGAAYGLYCIVTLRQPQRFPWCWWTGSAGISGRSHTFASRFLDTSRFDIPLGTSFHMQSHPLFK